jgi:hypothetical protein
MKLYAGGRLKALDARLVVWLLLSLTGLVALIGPALEARRRAPEVPVRAYLAAVERADVDAALATLAPGARDASRERVERQLGNAYRVEGLVLGAPSFADRLLGRPRPPAWVHVAAEIAPAVGERWKSSSTATLVELDGSWYLAGPLFA